MGKQTFKPLGAFVCATALTLVIAACGGGGGGPTVDTSTSGSTGTVSVKLADAPSCGYDHVYITIDKVRINASATAADTDSGWTDIMVSPTQRFDLLTLSNGVLATLGEAPLAAGHYSQIELVLAANDSTTPLANSVVPTGGTETALTTPSAQQSGLKLNADITVTANQLADVVLDFNACKSIVRAGNSGKYLLKPVIAVTPNFISGVSGYVDATLANGNTLVTVQQSGTVVKATAPDSTGQFLLEPVAPGSYDLVITAPGRATTVITGVQVASNTVTAINATGTPLTPLVALDGTAAGNITTASSPILASVDATQVLANGDTIDVADTSADSVSGAYALSLPAATPNVAAYASGATSYTFTPDTKALTNYTLNASSGGANQTAAVTIAANATVTTNFSF